MQSAVMPQYIVCPSVRDVELCFHTAWNSSKIISRPNNLTAHIGPDIIISIHSGSHFIPGLNLILQTRVKPRTRDFPVLYKRSPWQRDI